MLALFRPAHAAGEPKSSTSDRSQTWRRRKRDTISSKLPILIVRRLFWLILVAVLAATGWLAWAMLIPTTPPANTFVMLRPGYSTNRIATELKAAGVIRNERAFVLWHYLHHRRSLKAGEYLFEKPASARDIHRRLARGEVYFHTVVVPEGYTMFDIAHAVEAAGLGPAADFLKVAQSDTQLIADLAPGAHSLEGYLFPDTYEFSRMQTMEDMAAAMVKQFRQVAHQIGLVPPAPVAQEPQSSSAQIVVETHIERTVTMASIVEKETS